jgi:hypothetical protein
MHKEVRGMVDITVDSVRRVRISAVEEYDLDDDDDDDEPYSRTITIETDSGVIELELFSSSEEDLELVEESE